MVKTTMKRLLYLPLLALLISCQRGASIKRTAYQSAANKSIGAMVTKLDAPIRAARSSQRGAVRLTTNGFDIWGNQPWAGQFLPNNIDEVSYQFFQMMAQIQGAVSNEQALALGIKAVNSILYGSPGFAVGNRFMDSASLNGLGFLQSWTLPGTQFSSFSGNFSLLPQFVGFTQQGGFFGGDLGGYPLF